jgi:hypothetical protein
MLVSQQQIATWREELDRMRIAERELIIKIPPTNHLERQTAIRLVIEKDHFVPSSSASILKHSTPLKTAFTSAAGVSDQKMSDKEIFSNGGIHSKSNTVFLTEEPSQHDTSKDAKSIAIARPPIAAPSSTVPSSFSSLSAPDDSLKNADQEWITKKIKNDPGQSMWVTKKSTTTSPNKSNLLGVGNGGGRSTAGKENKCTVM